MAVGFWICIGIVAYTYVGYPILLLVLAAIGRRPVAKRYESQALSVVLAVKDEEINVKARIENLLAQDYPDDLVEIVVVSDGSTDRTVEIARTFEGERVKVVELASATGKSGALNHGVAAASHPIIVFCDARQRFAENVFAELVAMFGDERVGAVSGELIIEPRAGGDVGEGVGMYWRYEKLIRRKESQIDSVVGATGSIYAIRRELFRELAPHTLLDDFLVPMRIVLAGYRVVFVRSARAYDLASQSSSQEFARKVRTLAGNFQAVAMEPSLVNPLRNRVFFQFVSHKLLRLLVPYLCIAALVMCALAGGWFYSSLFAAQLLFYLLGLVGSQGVGGPIARLAWTFIVLNAAAVAALWVFATRREKNVWKRTDTGQPV